MSNNPYLKDGPFGMLKGKKETERLVHKQVAAYMRAQYPKIRFYTSLDGEHFGKHQRMHIQALQWGRGFPDFLIFHRRDHYTGLALEIKKSSEKPFKKDGTLKKNQHLEEQQDWLDYLEDCGWSAMFGVGFENCKSIIDNYIRK